MGELPNYVGQINGLSHAWWTKSPQQFNDDTTVDLTLSYVAVPDSEELAKTNFTALKFTPRIPAVLYNVWQDKKNDDGRKSEIKMQLSFCRLQKL
jgi:hypothetical protein